MVTEFFKTKILKFFSRYFEVFLLNSVVLNQIKHITNESIRIPLNDTSNEIKIISLFKLLVPLLVRDIKLKLVGNGDDGSYVFPILNGSKLFISGGIGNDLEFEKYFEKENTNSYFILIDGTIKNLPTSIINSNFIKKNISDNESKNNKNINLNELFREINFLKYDYNILKLDIEGDEYNVLFNLDENYLEKFHVLVIEFHDLINKFLNYKELVEAGINKIITHMNPIYISVNNYGKFNRINHFFYPDTLELTFINKKLGKASGYNIDVIKDYEFKNNPNGLYFDLYNFYNELILKK